MRDPETGRPSMALEYYAEVIEEIRKRDKALIINFTTGPGGRFVPSENRASRGCCGHHAGSSGSPGGAYRRAAPRCLFAGPQYRELRRGGGHQHAPRRKPYAGYWRP
ncbi:3-keto-5-aminohexanoate cleavage protein [Cupriavidus basilensis]